MPAGLHGAVKALKLSLQKKGSNLVVVEGKATEWLPRLVLQHGVSSIIAEEEVEYR